MPATRAFDSGIWGCRRSNNKPDDKHGIAVRSVVDLRLPPLGAEKGPSTEPEETSSVRVPILARDAPT
jgi:hypothetical protein